MDPVVLDGIIRWLLEVRGSKPGKQVQLSEAEIRQLCTASREVFLQQPNLVELEAPIKICGGVSKDELFGKFLAALDKTNFLFTSPGGADDHVQVAKATEIFNDAITELGDSREQTVNLSSLAETFKSKGNKSMQLKLYSEAIELYTCAIALCEKNAIYYCNRAAAYNSYKDLLKQLKTV